MSYSKLPTYADVLKSLSDKKRQKHLLLGNGFSMAYDHEIFSYNALYRFIEDLQNDTLSNLFDVINTKNFEEIMRQLDNFVALAKALGADQNFIDKLTQANTDLRESLIDAIRKLHPSHVFEIPENESKRCYQFLSEYMDNNGMIFTTNYDLLLYWVLMRNESQNAVDGFGRELENPKGYKSQEDLEFSKDLIWGKYKSEQCVFYVHGTLPIFDTGVDIVKEVYDTEHYLLENINARLDHREYPIFVTAGTGNEKLQHIVHNRYLMHCYESLSNIEGSLVTFGFNFGDYDHHIIEAINKAAKQGKKQGNKLHSVYIGVYSEADYNHILEISSRFNCKVNLYDARTANIWRDS